MHRVYANVNDALPDLAGYVLEGEEVGSRDGSRVMERLHETVTLTEPRSRYMLLAARKASLPAQIAETMWVLSGRDDVDWLSTYLPRAPQFSDDGEVWRGAYGPRLRSSGEALLDQVDYVVELLKKDPLTRRAVIQIYNADIDSQPGKDIPCNDFITFQSRLGELHMHVFVRSNDLVWGWSGINTFEWSVLQEVIASILGIGVGHLTFATSSLHIYDRHWKKMRDLSDSHPTAGFTPWDAAFDAPKITSIHGMASLDMQLREWFRAEELIRKSRSYGSALDAAEAAGVDPLFRDWLRVIAAWWWRADEPQVKSYTLRAALSLSPKRKISEPEPEKAARPNWDDFVDGVVELHRVKHESYGDSWKKRGETLGVLANIARKVDRLGATDQYETAMDTAVDLLVYLAKMHTFLSDLKDNGSRSDEVAEADALIMSALRDAGVYDALWLEDAIGQGFDNLAAASERKEPNRQERVENLIRLSAALVRTMWEVENELLSPEGWPFSTNPDDYTPMCRSCHRKFDNQRRKKEQNK